MIRREIERAWGYYREQGFRETLLSREAPFFIQFGKYGVCGVLSVLVLLAVTWGARALSPESFALTLDPEKRAFHNSMVHFVAFVPSNFTAYALNRWLVFTPGRHSTRKELILFTLISLVSFALGEILPAWLVSAYNLPNAVADLSFVVSSALVNFACRKFLVFAK